MENKEVVVAKLEELPDGTMKEISVAGGDLLLTNVRGEISALGALCTHYSAHLKNGILSGETVVCPNHQACFCAKSGDLKEPPALNALPKFEVVIRGEDIVVRLPEKMGKMRIPDMVAPDPTSDPRTFVILGAGAAGNAAAQSLRENGFQGRILIISNEGDVPYDRPNLNKDYLQGEAPDAWMPLRSEKFFQNRGIELLLRKNVTALDSHAKTIAFEKGETLRYDKLLLASGSIPKKLNVPGEALANVFTLRSFDDARTLIKSCEKASRAVIVGASFLGLESAASLRKRGLQVTVVAREDVLFERVFGPEIGGTIRQAHEENGTKFQLGTTVERIEGENAVKAVFLTNGTRIDTDLVLIAIGVTPNTGYLKDIPREADGGVVTDSCFRVAEDVYAAGDIACVPGWPTGEHFRFEHWRTAEQQGRDAALNMAGHRKANANVPFFWTRQVDWNIRYVGYARDWDEIVLDMDAASKSFIAFYIRNNEVQAAAGCKRDKQMAEILQRMSTRNMPSAEEIRARSIDFPG